MSEDSKSETPLIFINMLKVMAAIEAIGKDQKNIKQNFMFRGIDDAYNVLHKILAENNIFCTTKVIGEPLYSEVTTKAGGKGFHTRIKWEFTFHTIDGSSIPTEAMGEAIDYGDKGCAKTLSISHKSALFSTFLIPTNETPDPDKDSHDLKSGEKLVKEVFDKKEDVLDQPPPTSKGKTPPERKGKISKAQVGRFFGKGKEFNWSTEKLKELIYDFGKYESSKDIDKSDYSAIINMIEGKEPDAKPDQNEHGF